MHEISSIKERILQFIEFSKISKAYFCKKTKISYQNLTGHSLSSELGGIQIAEILQVFPEISSDWLILGKGNMIRNDTPNNIHIDRNIVKHDVIGNVMGNVNSISDGALEAELLQENMFLKQQIEASEKIIVSQKQLLEAKDKIIALLECAKDKNAF